MNNFSGRVAKKWLVVALLSGWGANALATGMLPDTSVVLINAGDGEGSINVKNTDDEVNLLHVTLEHLPEDTEELLILTTPIARVEAGEKQLVRFIYQADEPITTQRMKRVTFEGIPPQDENGSNKVRISVRQNLPVIISPPGLPRKDDPWTLLEWKVTGNVLNVRNDSPYVVRLNQQLEVLPAKIALQLPRTYLLPGSSQNLTLPAGSQFSAGSKVRLYPASIYGYQDKPYDAPLTAQ